MMPAGPTAVCARSSSSSRAQSSSSSPSPLPLLTEEEEGDDVDTVLLDDELRCDSSMDTDTGDEPGDTLLLALLSDRVRDRRWWLNAYAWRDQDKAQGLAIGGGKDKVCVVL